MSFQFCMLGSGSQGNAALLMTPSLHVLIDAGFLPDDLAARLDGTGASWDSLDAIVLTHTHGDHLKKKCLKRCAEHGVRFICHEHHVEQLGGGRYFKRLFERGLVQTYDGTHEFQISAQVQEILAMASTVSMEGNSLAAESAASYAEKLTTSEHTACAERTDTLVFHPILVPHDCPPTFGFRIEAALADRTVQVGYLADLGECDEHIAEQMCGVDLLALEFNHDVGMQVRSGRHQRLIDRCLGREGHLSNSQAADVLSRIFEKSSTPPKILIQLHLSEECNKPELAYRAAQEAVLLSGVPTKVYSSRQDQRGTIHEL